MSNEAWCSSIRFMNLDQQMLKLFLFGNKVITHTSLP